MGKVCKNQLNITIDPFMEQKMLIEHQKNRTFKIWSKIQLNEKVNLYKISFRDNFCFESVLLSLVFFMLFCMFIHLITCMTG